MFETRKKRRIRTLERKGKKVFEQGRREGECERVIRFNDGAWQIDRGRRALNRLKGWRRRWFDQPRRRDSREPTQPNGQLPLLLTLVFVSPPLFFSSFSLSRARLSRSFPFVQILNDFPYRFFSHINTHTYTYIYILEIKSSKFRLSWCLHTHILNRRSFEYLDASSIFLLNSSSSLESILSSKF